MIKQRFRLIIIFTMINFALSLLFIKPSYAFGRSALFDRIAIGYGWDSNFNAARLSFQRSNNDFDYWEVSLSTILSKHRICGSNNQLFGGSLIYVLYFSPKNYYCFNNIEPYIEGGLGLAAYNKHRIYVRQLGSNVLLEVKLGIGFRFLDNFDLGYKYIHNSNAYLGKHNNALNLNFIIFTYCF